MIDFNLNYLRRWLVLFQVLLIYNLNVTVLALENVTVDDPNPSIIYSPRGAWAESAPSTLDFGGTHMLTSDPSATASFNFTGIAIYFLSPLWPYTVNTAISLDFGPSTLVDLVDHSRLSTEGGPETVRSQIVWSATGLLNTQHNLMISVGAGQPYAIVDGLIYTTDSTTISASPSSSVSPVPTVDPITASSTSTSQVPTATSSTANAALAASRSPQILTIIFSSLLGILSLLVIVIALLYYFRRRRRPAIERLAHTPSSSINPSMSTTRLDALNNHRNAINNYRTWTRNQVDDTSSYAAVIQSNDGQIWHNPSYSVNTRMPPLPPTSHPAAYQDDIGPSTVMHRHLTPNR